MSNPLLLVVSLVRKPNTPTFAPRVAGAVAGKPGEAVGIAEVAGNRVVVATAVAVAVAVLAVELVGFWVASAPAKCL